MRRLLVASVLAAGLAGAFAHSHGHESAVIRRRKTMGFGPDHPHAVFNSEPVQPNLNYFGAPTDPYVVAKEFVTTLTADARSPGSSFYIRDDSYTDKNTGITHVYVRQLMYGVEVADGDINLNIKNGKVLSYGDSFYRGSDMEPRNVDVHGDHCSRLLDELSERVSTVQEQLAVQFDGQVVMERTATVETLGELPFLVHSNCQGVEAPNQMFKDIDMDELSTDPSPALLRFMISATPNRNLYENMLEKPEDYLSRMTVIPVASLVGDGRVTHQSVIDNVPDTVSPVKARMAFVQVPHEDSVALELVWKFEVEMEDNWYEAAVTNKAPHRIVSVVDWASDSPMPVAPVPKEPTGHPAASYKVFHWGANDPTEGNRTIEKEGHDRLASPFGWHTLPYANDPSTKSLKDKPAGKLHNTTTTFGNNAIAHENWEGQGAWLANYRPDAGPSMKFHYEYNPHKTERGDSLEEAKGYINATITQLFYTTNMVHDLYYRYGFDELAGNFQQYNFGRGGKENDAVIANAQDGSGYNNANFMTPPDGQNGRCRMYLWNTANPYRDGDLEAGIVIHELSHGLSTRLTGGPANSGCLGWGEAGGMGEGWGDFLATVIRSNANYSDYAMGAWAANRPNGIRNFVYSLDKEVNPSSYKTLDKSGYWGVHAIGEVWAEILWVVANRLIQKHGFSDSLFPPEPLEDGTIPEGDFYRPREYTSSGEPKPLIPKHGNALIVQLVLNGMKMQPCRPSFFDARDAIIEADKALTGGENHCDMWIAFAERGLGPHARVDGKTPWGGGIRTEDYSIPDECKVDKPDPEPTPKPTPPGDGDDDDEGGDDDDWPWV